MVKKQVDDSDRYIEISCPCCTKCRYDRMRNCCLFGGPFKGYANVKDSKTGQDKEN